MGETAHQGDGPNPRILLLRPDHLGDVLVALPAAALLRRALPGARLAFAVGPGGAAVPARCPAVDETVVVPFPPISELRHGLAWGRVAEREAGPLRGRFDAALLPRPDDPWSGALAQAAGIPVRLGYPQLRTRPFLTHPVEQRPVHDAVLGLDLAASLLALLGHGPLPPHAEEEGLFVPTAQDEDQAEGVLRSVERRAGRDPVVLHPGTGWAVKNWPPARWGALAAALATTVGRVPVVTGTAGERGLIRSVVEASGGRAVGLGGRLGLGGLAAFLRRARLVVASDSGPVHLAAMLGAPVVALFGPGDPSRSAPWRPRSPVRVVRVELPCSPCRELERPPCGAVREPACMFGIGVDQVLRTSLAVLEREPARRPA